MGLVHGPGPWGAGVVHGLGPWVDPWTPVHVLYMSIFLGSFNGMIIQKKLIYKTFISRVSFTELKNANIPSTEGTKLQNIFKYISS